MVVGAPVVGLAVTLTVLVPGGSGTLAVKLVPLVIVAGTALTVTLLAVEEVLPATVWLVESIPATGPPTPAGDRVEVELFVGGDAWLERLLLRLGPDARVLDPPEYATLAAEAAARVLRRYRSEDT